MVRRNTIQKELILHAVQCLQNHATANDIYNMITKEHPSIGKGTVYRNLNILAEEGKIRKIEVTGGPDCFDHICEKHCHVRCIRCGRLFDVDVEPFPEIRPKINQPADMEFLDYDILFKGICSDCRNAK
ncbi:MAG: Fur family transcriptional regulator [Lachnospiraceae bacterium]